MYKKCAAHVKFVFFAIVCLFFCHSDCHRCLALHDFIFCLRKFINESFAFNPGEIYIMLIKPKAYPTKSQWLAAVEESSSLFVFRSMLF